MKIILISGKAQHGKDTFANLLMKNFEKADKSCRIIHFGDAVKYVAKNFFGWNGKKDEVGRAILQKVGTDIVRKRDEHFWTDFVARLIPSFESDYILIPDWRFDEEYSHLLNYFNEEEIITVRINRYSIFQDFDKNVPYINPLMTPEQLLHRSETELDDFIAKYTIVNATLEDFSESAEEFVEELTTL